MLRYSSMILTLLMTLSLISCSSDSSKPPGSAVVKWVVSGSTCSEAGIDTIEVSILDELSGEVGPVDQKTCIPCSQGQQGVEFDDLDAGTYSVLVEGFAEGSSVPIYEGTQEALTVTSGQETTSQSIGLTQKGAGILVAWKFDNGGLCSFNSTESVELHVKDSVSATKFADGKVFPCDPFSLPEEEQPPELIMETDRAGILISDIFADAVDVQLFALSPDGTRVFQGKVEGVEVKLDRAVNVTVTLKECNNDCY